MSPDTIRSRIAKSIDTILHEPKDNAEKRIRLYALIILHGICLLYFVFFGLKTWHEGMSLLAAANGFSFVLISINLFVLGKKQRHRFAAWHFLTVVGLFVLLLVLTGGSQGSGHLWLFGYSIGAMLLLRRRDGTILTVIFLSLVSIILLMPVRWEIQYVYTLNFKLRLIASLLLVQLISLTYELAVGFTSTDLTRRIQKYHTLYNNVPIGLYSATASGRIIDANQALADLFGCSSPRQLITQGLFASGILPESVSPKLRMRMHIRTEEHIEGITRTVRRSDGTDIVIREKIRRIPRDGHKKDSSIVFEGSVEDITALKEIESRKESYKNDLLVLVSSTIRFGEAQTPWEIFHILLEQATAIIPEAIIAVSEYTPATHMLKIIDYYAPPHISATLISSMGDPRDLSFEPSPPVIEELSRGEIIRLPGGLNELLHEKIPAPFSETVEKEFNLMQVWAIGVNFRDDLFGCASFILRDGCSLSTDKRDVLETLCSQAAVMLKRNAIESQLRRQHALTSTLLETMPTPVFFKDRDGRYLGCNGAMERFIGKTREFLTGKTAYDIAPREIASEYEKQDNALFASESIQSYEWKVNNAAGSLRDVKFYKACIHNESGEVAGLVGTFVDITEEKVLLQTMAKARNEAEKAAEIKMNLMSAVTHEMRTPLTTIVSIVESQLAESAQPSEEQLLLSEASQHLQDIVDNIITLTKLESGLLNLQESSFDPEALVEEIFQSHYSFARDKGLDLIRDTGDGLPPVVHADRTMIAMVLRHIVSNAIKFTAEGSVTISARTPKAATISNDSRGILFTVSDTGPGIPGDLLRYVYDPFWQEDQSSTRKYGGLGLGLPLAYRLVKCMGGSIDITCDARKKTVVTILIPAAVEFVRTNDINKEA